MFTFERLEAWKKAIEIPDDVYRLTRGFPDYEKFGLANQMRRAFVSIYSNIAEGASRSSARENLGCIEIAHGSTMEIVSQAHSAQRQSFILTEEARRLYQKADEIARMLGGPRSSLKKKED